jgi:hypothetical protein
MPDPKMLALADYLRKNYRPAGQTPPMMPMMPMTQGQVPPESVPRMTDDQNRTAAFVRGAPEHLPIAPAMKRQKALAMALLRPTGGRGGRAVRESMNAIDD